MTPKQFGEFYLLALKYREASYKTSGEEMVLGKYAKSNEEAATDACRDLGHDEKWVTPIMILMTSGYTDVDDWARSLA